MPLGLLALLAAIGMVANDGQGSGNVWGWFLLALVPVGGFAMVIYVGARWYAQRRGTQPRLPRRH